MIKPMAPSWQDAFGFLAHELAHPLARLGSEADILALEAIRELERAYGPGPRYEAARSKIMAQRARVREAHEAAVGVIRLGSFVIQTDRGSIDLHLRPASLSSLVEETVKSSAFRTASLSIEAPEGRDQAVCDEDLMRVALGNVLRSGLRKRRSPVDLRVRLRREAEDIVIALPWSTPSSDGPLDMEHLHIFIAKRILELHDGILRCTRSGGSETELRWPSELAPGERRVPLGGTPR